MANYISYSVVIPCLNEEDNIVETISSIKNQIHQPEKIIVVDNGSSDDTVKLARELGVDVIISENTTIGGSRNIGAKHYKNSKYILFIDADVILSSEWSDNFQKLLKKNSYHHFFTGSRLHPIPSKSPFIRDWFSLLVAQTDENYINSGHLLVSRSAFEKINGFNANLNTAEDYDLGVRAIEEGIKVTPDKSLVAFHSGYPESLLQFFRREAWHGRQDFSSLGSFAKSKTAIASVLSTTLTTLVIIGILLSSWTYILFLSMQILLVFSVKKKKFSDSGSINTYFICFIYLTARSLAFLKHLHKR